jgi:hypothetical protein
MRLKALFWRQAKNETKKNPRRKNANERRVGDVVNLKNPLNSEVSHREHLFPSAKKVPEQTLHKGPSEPLVQ